MLSYDHKQLLVFPLMILELYRTWKDLNNFEIPVAVALPTNFFVNQLLPIFVFQYQ